MRKAKSIGLMLLLGISAPLFARPVAADMVRTDDGAKAIVFKFDGLSNLGLSGYEGGLGMRYYLKDRLALRPALRFGWSNRRTHPLPVPPGQPIPSDERRINTTVGLEVALERHLLSPGPVSPYLGVAVSGLHYDYKNEPSVVPGSPAGTVTKVTNRGTNGGLVGLLGFEWGFTESLTLGGETRFGLTIDTGKTETEAVDTPDRLSDDFSQFSVGFETVSVLLSVAW